MSITQIHLETRTTTEVGHASPRPQLPGALRRDGASTLWLNVNAPTDADLDWLARTFQFHPLAIEDCRNFNQRAKVEAYDGAGPGNGALAHPAPTGQEADINKGYLFLSLTTAARDGGELFAHEMEAFLGPDYLITVHREPLPVLDAVREQAAPDVRPDQLLHLIVDRMVDEYFPLLDEMEDEIDTLEDEILEKATPETLHRIFRLKQQLVFLRKITAPMREVMNALAGTRYGLVEIRTALYFRDAYDHLVRIYDLIETSRDLLGNALDAYLSTVSNRLNEVMKRLTLITTIFMPLSVLVGFGGMNFQHLPFGDPTFFAAMMVLLAVTPVLMFVWFRRSQLM